MVLNPQRQGRVQVCDSFRASFTYFCGSVIFFRARSAIIVFNSASDIMRILFTLVCRGQRASFLNITAELKASELSSSNKQHVVVVYWLAFNVNDRRQTEGLSAHTGLICLFLPGSIKKCFNESVRVKRLNKSARQRRGSTHTFKNQGCVENQH